MCFSLYRIWRIAWFTFAISAYGSTVFPAEYANLAQGAHYKLTPAANYDLTNDDGDSIQLTDGHYSANHFWTSRDAVGWKESGLIQIEIDLNRTATVNAVCINTVRGDYAGVSFPEGCRIFTSVDKISYSDLGDVYQGRSHDDGSYLVQKFCATNIRSKGRYVLLVVQPKGSFTFLDEIEVLGQLATTSKETPAAVSIKSEEIEAYLRVNHTNQAKKKALVRLAAKMTTGSAGNQRRTMQNSVTALISRIDKEQILSSEVLNRYQDELLSLHRLILRDSFSKPLIVWRKNPWMSSSPIDTPTPDALLVDELIFNVMQRGSMSNAFVLTNNSDEQQILRIVDVSEDPTHNAPKLEIREVVPVIAANYETIGDALRLLDNSMITIKPGESKQIWLTSIAGTSAPRTYKRKLKIITLGGNYPSTDVSLRLNVWPIAFPDRQHAFVNSWAYLNSNTIKKYPELAMTDLLMHHINLAELHSSQIPWPNAKGKADYVISDKILRYQKDARKRLFFFEFNTKQFRDLGGKYEFMSPGWRLVFKKWIHDWVVHLKAQGLKFRDFAFYPVDEPKNEEVGYLIETAKLIKEVDPRLEVYTTLGSMSDVDLKRAKTCVDIFQVLTSDLQSARYLTLRELGKEVWVYTANGGKTAPPIGSYRLEAWKAFKYGATGFGFWAYADAGWSGTVWDDFDGKRPDFSVVYEGINAPISSKRWEAWREGVEDYELLLLAKRKVQSGSDSAVLDTSVGLVLTKAEDYSQFEKARLDLLSFVSIRE